MLMRTAVVGFCRFSYLGRGDWSTYRDITPGAESSDLFDRVAAELYAPDRMERRLATFAQITLPSIRAQTEKNFVYVVITSQRMPALYQARLRALCATCENVELVISPSTELGTILTPILADLNARHDQVLQFRLDDDDAIACHYVEKVHEYAARMAGMSAFALTFTKGLHAFCYPDEKIWYAWYEKPFQSAAAIIKFPRPDRAIFDIGHFAMQQRYIHIQDTNNVGAFMMKWPSDSRVITQDALPDHLEQIGRPKFNRAARAFFPGLDAVDFNAFRTM
ncbi:hypothetical protein ERN12_06215 [Rhodobacteraceae bacterium]|nr:hypothetical protein ERN12_06215 [Paracoccaceae bacterium]